MAGGPGVAHRRMQGGLQRRLKAVQPGNNDEHFPVQVILVKKLLPLWPSLSPCLVSLAFMSESSASMTCLQSLILHGRVEVCIPKLTRWRFPMYRNRCGSWSKWSYCHTL